MQNAALFFLEQILTSIKKSLFNVFKQTAVSTEKLFDSTLFKCRAEVKINIFKSLNANLYYHRDHDPCLFFSVQHHKLPFKCHTCVFLIFCILFLHMYCIHLFLSLLLLVSLLVLSFFPPFVSPFVSHPLNFPDCIAMRIKVQQFAIRYTSTPAKDKQEVCTICNLLLEDNKGSANQPWNSVY